MHSATGQTPYKARDKDNEFKSRLNIAMEAKKQRLYPELPVGDKFKNQKEENNNGEGENLTLFER